MLASIVAPDEETSPLQVLEKDGQARMMLDQGRADPNDFSANGHHDS
ncbi:MAG: hypothetical protein ABEL51_07435 [Salinibacter sp.]